MAEISSAIDDRDWSRISNHLENFESQRDSLMRQSRGVQKLSKLALHSIHKGSIAQAEGYLKAAEADALVMQPILQEFPSLRQGSFSGAMEEYTQAVLFKVFLEEGRLVRSSELPLVEAEEFLAGVLGFTEELSRHAVQRATLKDAPEVKRCRDVVDAVLEQFLRFDLRNSALRRKYDGLKYTLKKLENTLYELSLVESANTETTPTAPHQ